MLKEFEPTFSRGGDMPMDFLSPRRSDPALQTQGEAAMQASLAKGMPHGYEVGYDVVLDQRPHARPRRARSA